MCSQFTNNDLTGEFKIYSKLGLIQQQEYNKFLDTIAEEINVTGNGPIKICELGSGFGLFSLPFIQKMVEKSISFEWYAFEKREELLSVYSKTIRNWCSTDSHNDILKILEENINRFNPGDSDNDFQTYPIPRLNSHIHFNNIDIQKIAYYDKNFDTGIDVLFAPFFFNHILGWAGVWEYFYRKVSHQGYIVLSKVGGDWWATEGVFDMIPDSEKSKDIIKVWISIWEKLKKLGIPNLYREISALNIQPIVDYIYEDGWELIDNCTKKVEEVKIFDANELKKMISKRIFSPFKIISEFVSQDDIENIFNNNFKNGHNTLEFKIEQWFEIYRKSDSQNNSSKPTAKRDHKLLNSFLIQRISLRNNYKNELKFWIQKCIEGLLNFKLYPAAFDYASFVYYSPQYGMYMEEKKDFFSWNYYYNNNDKKKEESLSRIELYSLYLKNFLEDFRFTDFLFKLMIKNLNLQPIIIFKFDKLASQIKFEPIDAFHKNETHDSRVAFYQFTIPQPHSLKLEVDETPYSDVKYFYDASPLVCAKKLKEGHNIDNIIKNDIPTFEIDENSWSLIASLINGHSRVTREIKKIKKKIEIVTAAMSFFFGTKMTVALPITSYMENQFVGTSILWLHFNEDIDAGSIFKDDITYLTLPFLQNFTNMLFNQELNILKSKHATRSAVAAIMSRNMSHNIGSHVLNYLSELNLSQETDGEHFETDIRDRFIKGKNLVKESEKIDLNAISKLKEILLSKFQEYLRERMDLVAAIPTNDPIWCLNLDIKENIMNRLEKKFDTQYYDVPNRAKLPELFFLLDNIAQSEGIRLDKIKFDLKLYGQSYDTDEKLTASVFGGILGTQCFYIILENFIRNSAKHGSKISLEKVKDNGEYFIIHIDFYRNWDASGGITEAPDDFIKIELYDNLGGWPRKKKTNKGLIEEEKIKDVIAPKLDPLNPEGALIDEEGKIREGNWGSKEMRIAASYLRGIPIEEIENPISGEPDIIEAFPVEDQSRENFKTLDGNNSLGYRFFLKKPKDILIISRNPDIKMICTPANKYKNEGIEIVDYEEFESKISGFTHEYFILDVREKAGLDIFEKHGLLFPIKTLFIYGDNKKNVKEKVKKFFRREKIVSKFLIKIECLQDNFLINYLIEKSNLGKKESIKDGFERLDDIKKFKLNIAAIWNRIIYSGQFNVKIYWKDISGEKAEPLTGGKYTISLIHPPLSSFNTVKGYREDIVSSKSLVFFSSGIANIFRNINEAFINLHTDNLDDTQIFLILKAFEISSYNCIIFDERIFKYQEKFKFITKGKFQVGKFWHFQNVIIFNMDKEPAGNINISYYPFTWSDEWGENICPKENKDAAPLKLNFEKILPPHFKGNVHFMIIHIGIIDKIGGKQKLNEWLNALDDKFTPWFLLIDSGRGHPEKEKMPENSRFQDFSNFRKYIIEEPDKFMLSNIIINARQ